MPPRLPNAARRGRPASVDPLRSQFGGYEYLRQRHGVDEVAKMLICTHTEPHDEGPAPPLSPAFRRKVLRFFSAAEQLSQAPDAPAWARNFRLEETRLPAPLWALGFGDRRLSRLQPRTYWLHRAVSVPVERPFSLVDFMCVARVLGLTFAEEAAALSRSERIAIWSPCLKRARADISEADQQKCRELWASFVRFCVVVGDFKTKGDEMFGYTFVRMLHRLEDEFRSTRTANNFDPKLMGTFLENVEVTDDFLSSFTQL